MQADRNIYSTRKIVDLARDIEARQQAKQAQRYLLRASRFERFERAFYCAQFAFMIAALVLTYVLT